MEQMMAPLLSEMKAEIRTKHVKVDTNLKEMKGEMMASLEAKMEANNKTYEALRGTVLSLMDIHQARTGHSRRNESQVEQKSRQDGGSDRERPRGNEACDKLHPG
jgi:hypothetical protein